MIGDIVEISAAGTEQSRLSEDARSIARMPRANSADSRAAALEAQDLRDSERRLARRPDRHSADLHRRR